MNRLTNVVEEYSASVFLDATYEGDLGAAANVPFRIGREGKDEFNEPGAGKIYKFWGGPEAQGTTFQPDNAVQAYNYRLCVRPIIRQIKTTVQKPANYNRSEYVSLIEDVFTGRNTGRHDAVTSEMMDKNRMLILKGQLTQLPGDVWGIHKITNMVSVPNSKTDANNQHRAFISTDLPEENWLWPTASWEWRDRYAQRLKEYTLGLIWFAQNDGDAFTFPERKL